MKKLLKPLFFLSVLVLATSSAQAQVEWGVTGGVNFASMDFTTGFSLDDATLAELGDESAILYRDLAGDSYKAGIHAGLYAMADIGALSFNPSLTWSNIGLRTDAYNTNLNYLSMPLLVGFQPFDLLHIQLGPQFGYLMKTTINPSEGEKYSISSDSDVYNKLDYGAVIGILLDLPGKIDLTARYTHGLGSVYDPVPTPEGDFKFQNRNFQFGVQYPIGYSDPE